ncbi:anti-sigma factor RsiW [Rubricella aquisinus]|uniref:Anti-sigma factor RsiW n=1 Tax=Rubricella aquisinus TaxID=2028108 RepID=A0A840X2V1_9RHOB|nr:anti-sigma factor [Rubricella aquisinus]MBB5514997.1 anti-sigma factor RsiW [Rubricella aquisinus]
MTTFTDEQLTAFLDGELPADVAAEIAEALERDEVLAARLADLEVDFAPIRAAFDALTPASVPMPAPQAANDPAPPRRWLGMTVAAGLALMVGFGAGFTVPRAPEPVAPPGWLAIVASYQALYSAETIAAVQPDAATQAAEVARVAQTLGAPLTSENVTSDLLRYARGQVLDLNGQPLAQLMYQAADGTPVALCVIATAAEDAPVSSRQIGGLNAAVWREGGFAYLVIGDTDAGTIATAAEGFAAAI